MSLSWKLVLIMLLAVSTTSVAEAYGRRATRGNRGYYNSSQCCCDSTATGIPGTDVAQTPNNARRYSVEPGQDGAMAQPYYQAPRVDAYQQQYPGYGGWQTSPYEIYSPTIRDAGSKVRAGF